jgi:hypothetical protein
MFARIVAEMLQKWFLASPQCIAGAKIFASHATWESQQPILRHLCNEIDTNLFAK